jgi:hypothetical protein
MPHTNITRASQQSGGQPGLQKIIFSALVDNFITAKHNLGISIIIQN